MGNEISKADISVGLATLTSIVGIVSHLKFDNSVTATITAIGVIATALLSYLTARSAEKSSRDSAREVATIAAKASTDNTSKTVLVQTVTGERAKWRSEMREHVAELVMLLRASARAEAIEWRRVDQLTTGIRLRLNPAGRGPATATPDKHERDRKVHAVLDELGQAGPQVAALHDGVADRLEEHMAAMLKGEWEVSKAEAVRGELAKT